MRVILYTGKGGVGKSSIAAATAVRIGRQGRRVLLISSDVAHNISDIFDRPVGGEPAEVGENLSALEVDTLAEIRQNWKPAHDFLTQMLDYLGMGDAVAEELALVPGIDELFLLTRILREIDSGRYDVVVVDCSPTGGTLRQLTLTDSASTKLSRLLKAERILLKLVRPATRRMKGIGKLVPEDEFYGVLDELILMIGRLGDLLKDPLVSSVRLVLNPDRVAIAETRRAFSYFGLFGFTVDGIFVNKVLPPELRDGYLHDWYVLQAELLESIKESFLEIAQFEVPLLPEEPIGLTSLTQMADQIFADTQPDAMLSPTKSVSFEQVDGRYQLRFWLPQLDKSDLDIGIKGRELILSAGSYTRVFSLPDTLADRQIEEATFRGGTLQVCFQSSAVQ
jgi:arsenite-transporting ATPase